jgi:hypothetical protein
MDDTQAINLAEDLDAYFYRGFTYIEIEYLFSPLAI